MDGPILLLAGPGTGKTYQIAKRIQSLVDIHGVDPDEITVITFTKEAARGMRNKLSQNDKPEYIEPSKRPKNILTMHSLGFKIIAEHPGAVGLRPDVTVVTDDVLRAGLMRDAACLVGLQEKDALIALKDKGRANSAASPESEKIVDQYNKILRACNTVDYDDQIALACEILESNSGAMAKYQASSKHLLIDEYQDINADQDRFIKLLTKGQSIGLFAVGDDDQSIYGFRGGEPTYIRKFDTEFAGAQVLQLQVSRRCRKNILDCAVALVSAYDNGRLPKADPIYKDAEDGLVCIWNLPSEAREATQIAKMIYAKTAEGAASDFFVLIPNRNYLKPIATALRSLGVQFEVGATGNSDTDWETLKIVRRWIDEPTDLLTRHVMELVVRSGSTSIESAKVRLEVKKKARYEFCVDIGNLWSPVLSGTSNLMTSLETGSKSNANIAEVFGRLFALDEGYKLGQLTKFLGSVNDSLQILLTVEEFYKCLSLISVEPDTSSGSSASVRILSYQSSKGLEADCVFLVGLEENSIPRDDADEDGTAEEARLVFVAMTRAKKELHLLHTRTRTGASNYKTHSHTLRPSVFVTSLPKAQVEEVYVRSKSAR
jgi:DNA helicase-2/ATP-dependent DNA helicase PcrA